MEREDNLPTTQSRSNVKEVKFDMEQLEKDVDKMFQQELEKNSKEFDSMVKRNMETYEKRVNTVLSGIKEELIQRMASRNNITLNIANREPISITTGHTDHPKTETVLKSLALNKKAMLVGPTGTGKTTMVEKIAEQMKVRFEKYSCSRDSSVHDLLGYKQPRSEEYLNTTFLDCYENGGIFLVDEYDAMSGDMALFFNGVCDNSKFISIPHRDSKPQAVKHKDFYIIMSGNTYGKGSVEYSGRDFQDLALMDRFRLCKHHIGYNEMLERAFMGNSYNWAIALRGQMEKYGSYLSTRNMEEISILLHNGMSSKYIIEMLTADMEETDIKSIKKALDTWKDSKDQETNSITVNNRGRTDDRDSYAQRDYNQELNEAIRRREAERLSMDMRNQRSTMPSSYDNQITRGYR